MTLAVALLCVVGCQSADGDAPAAAEPTTSVSDANDPGPSMGGSSGGEAATPTPSAEPVPDRPMGGAASGGAGGMGDTGEMGGSGTGGTPPEVEPPDPPEGVPLVLVTLMGQPIGEEKVPVSIEVIEEHIGDHTDLETAPRAYEGPAAIEFRGTTSLTFDKKSYTLETRDALGEDLDVALVGLPAESDWVLYGPYSDKTFIRNVLAYELGRQLGDYQPKTRYVELFVDGQYQGVYVLTEKIKRDKHRVDIQKLPVDSLDITGGYIFRREARPEKPQWVSEIGTVWYYHHPKARNITEEQRTYLQEFLNQFEGALSQVTKPTPMAELSKWMDVPVWVHYVMIQELSRNVDSYKKSFYASKRSDQAGGQVVVGPLWDFNVAWGNIDFFEGHLTEGLILPTIGPFLSGTDRYQAWWDKLMANDAFSGALRCRWEEARETVLSEVNINKVIDTQVEYLMPVRQRDDDRWNTIGTYLWPNYTVEETWDAEVTRLRNWATARALWLDDNLPGVCP